MNVVIENKYSKKYFEIIFKAQYEKRTKGSEEYYEKHHILPKSIWPEYKSLSEYPWNCILLTAKEHFLCHWLLCKCFEDIQHRAKMNWAFHRMAFSKTSKTNRNISSAQYQLARKIHSNNMKGDTHPSKTNPAWMEGISDRVKKSWENADGRRAKTSKWAKRLWAENYEERKENAKKAAIKGGIASAKKTKGKKFQDRGFSGKSNPIAIHWTVVGPDGSVTECYGDLNKYAEKHGLKYDTLKKFGVKNQNTLGHKGHRVFRNGRIKDLDN